MKIIGGLISAIVLLLTMASPAYAWSTDQGSIVYCSDNYEWIVEVHFTNTEPRENRNGQSLVEYFSMDASLNGVVHTVEPGETIIWVETTTLGDHRADISLTWTDGRSGTDSRSVFFTVPDDGCTPPETTTTTALVTTTVLETTTTTERKYECETTDGVGYDYNDPDDGTCPEVVTTTVPPTVPPAVPVPTLPVTGVNDTTAVIGGVAILWGLAFVGMAAYFSRNRR